MAFWALPSEPPTRARLLLEAIDRAVADACVLVHQPFDVIFTDLQMPGMHGVEAARAIRTTSVANRHIPIVALTAYLPTSHR